MTKKRSLLLHGPRQPVPHAIGAEGAVQQEHGIGCGEPQNVLALEESELMTGDETRRADQIRSADRLRPERP